MADIISVKQQPNGLWRMTVNGVMLGDTRAQSTREEAIAYATRMTENWIGAELDFG